MTGNKLKTSEKIFLIAVILILLIIPGDLNFLHHGYLSGFLMQNWSVSYDTGFVLRGLPGTIMSALFNPITSKEVMAANYVFLIAYIAYIYLAAKAVYKSDKGIYNLIFLLFILVQPSVLQRLISSSTIGRLDPMLAVVLMSCLLVVLKAKKNALKYISLNLLTLFALLCHEGFAVFAVPVIFALLFFGEEKKLQPVIFYLAPSVIFWALITAFGGADVTIDEFMAMINTNTVTNDIYPIYQYDVEAVYFMTISEKISYTFGYYSNTVLAKLFLTFAMLSPTVYCLGAYWKAILKAAASKKEKHMLLIACLFALSPFAAMLFAVDSYRWISWALFNQCAALVFLYLSRDEFKSAVIKTTEEKKLAVIFAMLFALLIGFFTVFSAYPFIEKYFSTAYTYIFG